MKLQHFWTKNVSHHFQTFLTNSTHEYTNALYCFYSSFWIHQFYHLFLGVFYCYNTQDHTTFQKQFLKFVVWCDVLWQRKKSKDFWVMELTLNSCQKCIWCNLCIILWELSEKIHTAHNFVTKEPWSILHSAIFVCT